MKHEAHFVSACVRNCSAKLMAGIDVGPLLSPMIAAIRDGPASATTASSIAPLRAHLLTVLHRASRRFGSTMA
ncbi:hypothetical protein RB195_007080 [Necator americanus]|uniref:Uncharacterized protein n=1 Tax=Necator americanus TaxID=51031 RepID=A0ABR1BX84_NECAM